MNKTVNTVLFMIGATLLNLLLIIVIFVALLILCSLFLDSKSESQSLVMIAYGLSIILAIGGGFFIYNRIVRWANNKWHLENYLVTGFKKNRR
ncbi:MAG: leader peptide processing enzyme [Spirochaetales bacterium]|nr:leader peptide processing enzyme [Spirochaetales bacterium]